MQNVRTHIFAVLVLTAYVGQAPAKEIRQAASVAPNLSAQVERESVTQRVRRWTRAGLEAAKKRWAEDQQRFSECTNELDALKKKSAKRISYDRQGRFLEKCMREKR
jgi:hypothetical protein